MSRDATRPIVWRLTSTLSLSRSELTRRAEAVGRLCPPAHKRMIGKYMVDVFGGAGFLKKRRITWVCVAMCSTRSSKPGMTRHNQFSPELDRTVSAGKASRDDFTSMTPHFALCQSYFRQCCNRKRASPCSCAVDSGTPVAFVVVGRAKIEAKASSLNASKDVGMGVVDMWIGASVGRSAYCSGWLSSHWSRRLARTDLPTYATLSTLFSSSGKMMTASCHIAVNPSAFAQTCSRLVIQVQRAHPHTSVQIQ